MNHVHVEAVKNTSSAAENNMAQNIYTGFHAVEERIRRYSNTKNNGVVAKVLYSKPGPRIKKIISQAKEAEIGCELVSEKELDSLVEKLPEQARDHRGIVLTVDGEEERAKNLVELEQWLTVCPENATVIMLDSVTDPHNVGAIIRSCDQFGASLLVIPDHRSASDIKDNDIIARTSAGASAWVSVAKVTNLVRAAKQLKEAGFWIYGADANGTSLPKTEFAPKSCIIMGSEGSGIARLLEEECDTIVSIPTCGKIDSLNVSVAAGVLLYEVFRRKSE